MSRRLQIVGVCAVLTFVAIQFIRPTLPHPPVTGEIKVSDPVRKVLRNSCYDCHSNQGRLWWYDYVQPGYSLVVSDIADARRRLNFSEIGTQPEGQQRAALYEALNQMQFGEMPVTQYLLVHWGARVTPADLAVMQDYLKETDPPAASAADVSTADDEYRAWTQRKGQPANVPNAPNGLKFPADYMEWQTVSSTNRFDNHTLRFVLGNEIAIAAIRSHHINPWPDGATFAKVAWFQLSDGAGNVRPGKFSHVEFMVKDAKKYASTGGWGWGRWRGANLVPYGENARFARECVGCHGPMRPNDLVFTPPVQLGKGALRGDLPYDPFQLKVIASSLNLREGTMSTLYGNDEAVRYARAGAGSEYPAGSVLSLVTWAQQSDDRWFGAKIPGPVQSVEFVIMDGRQYRQFTGSPLQPGTPSADVMQSRIAYILAQRASVMP